MANPTSTEQLAKQLSEMLQLLTLILTILREQKALKGSLDG